MSNWLNNKDIDDKGITFLAFADGRMVLESQNSG